jgi:apolipoprotein N-acyltransferase
VVRRHAQVVLWSEIAYPTTFGHPKRSRRGVRRSELPTSGASGVPSFVFGNFAATATVNVTTRPPACSPSRVFDRLKTRLFPFTEWCAGLPDGPRLRSSLPWTGNWRGGNGARVPAAFGRWVA